MGVYRFWRDLGYAIAALISGIIADLLGKKMRKPASVPSSVARL
jgi:hypothetical protein